MNLKEKFFRGVVGHKKLILIVFAISTVFFAFCNQFVSVNYDMNAYLPENAASTQSLELMKKEFGSGIPNARVMVSDVTIPQALEMKKKIEKIDGVTDVIWLDDVTDVTKPILTIESDLLKDYYHYNNALFLVTIEDDKRLEAVDSIELLIGEGNSMTGAAVDTATATQSTTSEIKKIIMLAVPFTLFILLLTTASWFEGF